ncbi:MAG: vitamin B12 dependent methionine synthase [Syntrophaceae bacterium]|nr:vitamin B12 dependent methionine synthase [Syntrophaceae bacterium]
MERILQIPFSLNLEEAKSKLRAVDWQQIQNLLEVANPLIYAQAVYEVSYIYEKLEDAVIIDGVCFNSQVLRKNLENVGRVFPYVVTIGAGLEQRVGECKDLLEQYYLDQIGNIALTKARKHLEEHLCATFAIDRLSYMSPGSLQDWPIEEQKPLFSVLKGAEELIGVRLNENLIMIPRKSVSGIFFPTDVTFLSCQLCQREKCEGRKAPYNEALARQYKLQG